MNRIIKRMALPVGAAIVLGSSGFAFMASNAVPATSLGQGSNGVTGYTVSGVHYESQQGWGYSAPTFATSAAKFTLTSASNEAPANGQPTDVDASFLGSGTAATAGTALCTVTSWTIDGTGHGTGAVVCRWGQTGSHTAPPKAADVTGLDVFASQ